MVNSCILAEIVEGKEMHALAQEVLLHVKTQYGIAHYINKSFHRAAFFLFAVLIAAVFSRVSFKQ